VKNSNVTESNLLTNKVDVQLDVLCATMMNGVGGEVDSKDVVAEDNGGLVNRTGKLKETDEAKCTQQLHGPQHDTQPQH
jgi:hypothetical protein